jgi:hypothetical protein
MAQDLAKLYDMSGYQWLTNTETKNLEFKK